MRRPPAQLVILRSTAFCAVAVYDVVRLYVAYIVVVWYRPGGVIKQITGCAVAQHCYNGDVSFLWEKWKL